MRRKAPIPLVADPPDFFRVQGRPDNAYIEPTIDKVAFDDEPPPSIILISAVGASGKTRLARELSSSTSLPVLDLGLCRSVGERTLTGVINDFFDRSNVTPVLNGLVDGSFGIIIDAVDEGRSKTNPDGFNAFLDDLINRCRGSETAVFVMLGRTVTLEECWFYLVDKGVNTALAALAPFSLKSATKYIDTFSGGLDTPHRSEYIAVRDQLLDLLKASFTNPHQRTDGTDRGEFLRFLGYPPVLDSIVTLLKEKPNYHALSQLTEGSVEAELVYKIATYILHRERDDKILPNVVDDRALLKGLPEDKQREIRETIFNAEEQCVRLVALCLNTTVAIDTIEDPKLNERYEEALEESRFLPEHPFLENCKGAFRNTVFESLALATLASSANGNFRELAYEYAGQRKSSYHFVYMLAASKRDDMPLDVNCLRFVVDAALEFRSVHAAPTSAELLPGTVAQQRAVHSVVDIEIAGVHWEDADADDQRTSLQVSIELHRSDAVDSEEARQSFDFVSHCDKNTVIVIGSRLAGTRVTVPCALSIGRPEEVVEMTAPVWLSAREIRFNTQRLSLRPQREGEGRSEETGLVAECSVLSAEQLGSIDNSGNRRLLILTESETHYPVVDYVERRRAPAPSDPDIAQKFLRMKRILLEFRSHGKGALARFCGKIDSQRVLKNVVGERVRDSLLRDGIMRKDGSFYFLNTDKLGEILNVSWQDLRSGGSTSEMMDYLKELS